MAGWRKFLGQIPERDYIFQKKPYEEQLGKAAEMINAADGLLIGAGAGLSAAAGLVYSGTRFTDNFREFIDKYGAVNMPDMYTAGFYPFATEEERWGYWSKHAFVNRIEPEGLPLYRELYELTRDKEYFVLTTNVDDQFRKAGFDSARIFAVQGDYGRIQCQKGCHRRTYDAVELFRQMNEAREDCAVPSEMVPKCPVCGGPMAMNLRCDQYFVEDEHWAAAAERYNSFLEEMRGKNLVLLETGAGFNTPGIIRFPFEKMAKENNRWSLIRLNLDEAAVPESLGEKALGIQATMSRSIPDILQKRRLGYLVEYLRREAGGSNVLPYEGSEDSRILRSLMNIRMPGAVSQDFLKVQDAYLKEELYRKGIVELKDIPSIQEQYESTHRFGERISLWQGDITRLKADAIVNAANSQMLGCFVPCHGCIDNAIHSAAGLQLRRECAEIMENQGTEEPTGGAKITNAYNLPCKYVIHTVGPIVGRELRENHCRALKSCYQSCLRLSEEKNLKSIAFCCISTGEFGFPNEKAAEIALETVTEFLENSTVERVVFNVFKDKDLYIYEKLIRGMKDTQAEIRTEDM